MPRLGRNSSPQGQFKVMTRSNFLIWIGLRQSVPLKLRVNIPNFNFASLKCHDYYYFLIKQKLEKPSKWVKLKKEFSLDDKQVAEAFLLPVRVANEPYQCSFRHKVLNSVLFTNDHLCRIGYVSNPNCFCNQQTETISHILFGCSFSYSFWYEVNEKGFEHNQELQKPLAYVLRCYCWVF